jgi:hypothetical protein
MKLIIGDKSTYPKVAKLLTIYFIDPRRNSETCLYNGREFIERNTVFDIEDILSWSYLEDQ